MKNVKNKLRVIHFPQVGSCRESFKVEVKDEEQAYLILNTLANQHLWLEKNNIIPEYSNTIFVEMWEDDIDGDNNPGWTEYFNEEEGMDWDDLEAAYFSNKI